MLFFCKSNLSLVAVANSYIKILPPRAITLCDGLHSVVILIVVILIAENCLHTLIIPASAHPPHSFCTPAIVVHRFICVSQTTV